jgi:glyoxylase-like metal-dependent hydrolase (beta-lactamase superfamily II)
MLSIVFAILILLSGCSSAPATGPEAARALIEESAAAMGGWPALDAVKSQEILTGGGDWEPMQAVEPDGEARVINTFGQTLIVDFENNRMRLGFDAMRSYPTTQPVKFTHVIDGDSGMLESTDASGKMVQSRLHPSVFATRLRDLNRLPIRVLYTAKKAPDLTRVEDRTDGKTTIHILRYTDAGLPVELHLDSFNKLPTRVIYTEDDPIYGDTLNELAYLEWRDYAGIRLPQSQVWFLNGNKIREERVRTLIHNPKLDESSLTVPENIRSQPENGARIVSQWALRRAVMGVSYEDFARDQKVEFVDVAKGIYHVKGSSHNSLAIEMKDHVVIVEAPLFEERSAAVIKAVEEKIPGKPIKTLIMTHFHIDHSGGLRAYAAKAATIVADEAAVPFLQTVMSRPKTIRPDSLAKSTGVTPNIEGVNGTKVLSDGERTIELRQIPNPHAAGMLAVYLPAEKLLFVSDLYSPGNPIPPGDPNARSLFTAITEANLTVDRIVGGHGGIGTFRDLVRISAPAGKSD